MSGLGRDMAGSRMGEAGRQRAPDYSWDRVTERIVDYYHEVRDRVLAPR